MCAGDCDDGRGSIKGACYYAIQPRATAITDWLMLCPMHDFAPLRSHCTVGGASMFDHHACVNRCVLWQATDEDGTKYLKGKAQLIEELESTLPDWVRQPHWYPPFVHMLKVRSRQRFHTAPLSPAQLVWRLPWQRFVSVRAW
jgi:hypothetical protein